MEWVPPWSSLTWHRKVDITFINGFHPTYPAISGVTIPGIYLTFSWNQTGSRHCLQQEPPCVCPTWSSVICLTAIIL